MNSTRELVGPTHQEHKAALSELQVFQQTLFQTESKALGVGWRLEAVNRLMSERAHWTQCLEGVQRQGINASLSFSTLCRGNIEEEGVFFSVGVSLSALCSLSLKSGSIPRFPQSREWQ